MQYSIKKCRVITRGDKEREIKDNVAHVHFQRPLLFYDDMDYDEFKILLSECFDDVFTPGVVVDCEIDGNIYPSNDNINRKDFYGKVHRGGGKG